MTLEKCLNICTVVLIVVVGGNSLYARLESARRRELSLPYHTGDTVMDTADLRLASADVSLVLTTASTCYFCTVSLPVYEKVTASAVATGVRVIAVTTEDPQVNREYLETHRIKTDAVLSAKQNGIVVKGTPALMLLDRSGRVLYQWLGKLAPEQEREVTQAMAIRKLTN